MLVEAKFEEMEARYRQIEQALADPELYADQGQYQRLTKELADLEPTVRAWRGYRALLRRLEETRHLQGASADDPQLRALAAEEVEQLERRCQRMEETLAERLHGGEDEAIDFIVEIRAGTGGAEASLFAADLFRMYQKYADRHGWTVESLGSHPTESGGFKEVIVAVRGKGAYPRMRYESGVHRVQRVPVTEASGRIHTSTATVAILPEPKAVDLEIRPDELKVDVYRSSGPGGQGVNTTDSAVRITHLPTGVVVTCQDERSQLKNKQKAMRVLRARLLEMQRHQQSQAIAHTRRRQIGSGERSEKIRTYNFPDRRITDHRIGFTVHTLEQFLEGDLDEMVEALRTAAAQGAFKTSV